LIDQVIAEVQKKEAEIYDYIWPTKDTEKLKDEAKKVKPV